MNDDPLYPVKRDLAMRVVMDLIEADYDSFSEARRKAAADRLIADGAAASDFARFLEMLDRFDDIVWNTPEQ